MIWAAAIVVGLCIGSFVNVVVARLPGMMEWQWRRDCRELLSDGQDQAPDSAPCSGTDTEAAPDGLLGPRSHCPKCHHTIGALENIPLISYIWLRGKCAHCQWKIPWRYPMVELLGALSAVAALWMFGATIQGLAAAVFGWMLLPLIFIDLEKKYLPDTITLTLLWMGLLINMTAHGFTSLSSAVLGASIGYLILWAVYHAFRVLTGKEGMGFGDFKLLAATGAWLGWQMLPVVILLSSAVGSIIGLGLIALKVIDRDHHIPFGPYLAVAGWIAMMWGQTIIDTYLGVAGISG